MSAAPFDTTAVITRLREQVPDLQGVHGAADYAAITSLRDFRPPCAFVLPVREQGDGEPPKNGSQRALVVFGVVVCVTHYRDVRGGEAAKAMGPLLGQIRQALIGWTPAVRGARPCEWIQGDLLDYDQANLLWSEVFQTQMFIGGS